MDMKERIEKCTYGIVILLFCYQRFDYMGEAA